MEQTRTAGNIWTDDWRFPATRKLTTTQNPFELLRDTEEIVLEAQEDFLPSSMASYDQLSDAITQSSALGSIGATVSAQMNGTSLAYGFVILVITLLLICSSVTIIAVLLTTEGMTNVIGYYLISLSMTDLLAGVLVTPLSIYSALDETWEYGPFLCKLESWLEITLWTTTVYMFIWLCVDRYAALHKPSRYDCEQTLTRCRCWIIFTWLTAMLLCCPTLFTEMQTTYYPQAKLCLLDWGVMKGYSVTLGVLVIAPPSICVIYAYSYIFSTFRNPDDQEQEVRVIIETDTSYMMTFFVILVFCLSWLPWFLLRAYEAVFDHEVDTPVLHFSLMWLAIGGGCWKFVIYTTMNGDFRRGFRALCSCLWCGRCQSRRLQYNSLSSNRRYT